MRYSRKKVKFPRVIFVKMTMRLTVYSSDREHVLNRVQIIAGEVLKHFQITEIEG